MPSSTLPLPRSYHHQPAALPLLFRWIAASLMAMVAVAAAAGGRPTSAFLLAPPLPFQPPQSPARPRHCRSSRPFHSTAAVCSTPTTRRTRQCATNNNKSKSSNKNIRPKREMELLDVQSDDQTSTLLPFAAAAAVLGAVAMSSNNIDVLDAVDSVGGMLQTAIADPQSVLQGVISTVQAMGPLGALYFGAFYVVAEILAVPATPLTLSAGTLFGWAQGTGIVLTAGTLAACIGFFIGKTVLRSYVEGVVAENPQFAKLDAAIGKDGFKLLVLVRLSPIFPFSLTNYVYGASSIDFATFFWGTLLGFTPSSIAYVYTGMVGQELLMNGATQPWYVYAIGVGAFLTFLKLVTEVASGLVEAIEDETPDQSSSR